MRRHLWSLPARGRQGVSEPLPPEACFRWLAASAIRLSVPLSATEWDRWQAHSAQTGQSADEAARAALLEHLAVHADLGSVSVELPEGQQWRRDGRDRQISVRMTDELWCAVDGVAARHGARWAGGLRYLVIEGLRAIERKDAA